MSCLVHEIIDDPDCPLCLKPHIDPETDVDAFLDRMFALTATN